MAEWLAARDLWPIIVKLSHEEQILLAKLALRAAATTRTDAEAYAAMPPAVGEFTTDEEPLSWEAEGWDQGDAPR